MSTVVVSPDGKLFLHGSTPKENEEDALLECENPACEGQFGMTEYRMTPTGYNLNPQ